jgi:hypothetical protein
MKFPKQNFVCICFIFISAASPYHPFYYSS